ncbi:MAG: tetratricopeptide repeat protein [Saprospiraceae bacterium]|nr:tetratricopeptide repeat protein [Candidatus Vicinibacter affinis]MBK7799131.1 tetratricopeptide repeat protein [Candidatus Vicinibacter affinis]MBK9642012.1 tetratricopeptide repeat protein [Candidatus Vicinibacter affinis]MBP6173802.1 tetratricopeptide repeat protein [Saprospiraceae bacterium]MBP6523149.1 tetratricopeptide repeat protein [Saprospiraceae bacterium]
MGKKSAKQKIEKATVVASTPAGPSWVIWAILGITFLVFTPSLQNGFVNWDDDRNVYENPLIKDLNSKNVKAIFQTPIIGNYNPLSILSFAIEHEMFGMSPKAMHWTNLLLHLLCTFFAFKIFQRLGLSIWFAALGALLFGIHPLRVESVAWITERKDVLFSSFFLPALYLYVKNLDEPKAGRMFWVFLLFAIGLFAKIQMVALPLSMIAVDYWKGRKIGFNLVLEKWAFFLGALAVGILGIYMLKQQGSLEANVTHAGIGRLFIGSYSLITYLIKWLIPYRMLPLYPYPEELSIWHYLSMPAAILILGGVYWAYKKDLKAVVFGFLFFFVNIVFLLQVLGAGQGYLADRFTYIAYIGLFFISCYYLQEFFKQNKEKSQALNFSLGVYLLFLGYLSFKQCHYWKDSGTLWTRVIEFYDNTSLPFNNRANHLRDLKLFDKALDDYNKAIELKAGHSTYNSRAKLFFNKNEDQKAILDYNKAIELNPTSAEYYTNRGAAHAKTGNLKAALEDLNKGVALDPRWKVAYLNRSIIYNQLGQYDKSLADIDAYLQLEPNDADLWYEGARCLRAIGDSKKAITYYDRALRINPRYGLVYLERGRTYQSLGNTSQAQADFEQARRLGEKVEEAQPLFNQSK